MKVLLLSFFFLLLAQLNFSQWVQVGLNDKSIKDIEAQNSTIFAVTSDIGKAYRSLDGGNNWATIVESNADDFVISPTGKLFMIYDDSLYYSLDNGDTWIWSNIVEQIGQNGNWGPITITVSPTGIVFCGLRYYSGSYTHEGDDKLAVSTDDGLNWTCPIEVLGGLVYGFREQYVITIGYSGRSGPFGSSYGYGINLSSDYGINWSLLESDGWETPRGVGCPQFLHAIGHFTNNNIILNKYSFIIDTAYTYKNELYISPDMCSTWTKISVINTQCGLSWSSGLSEGILIGTDSFGVVLFSDNGDSLGSRNNGLTDFNIQALTLDNNGYIYAGTGNGVWRRPLSEIVVSAEELPNQLPLSFGLYQNYPNPFNPTTTIKYQIRELSFVTLKVYDILGNEIKSLVNEEKAAGIYELEFNASSVTSGVYFYQLKAGPFVETKKMLLIK